MERVITDPTGLQVIQQLVALTDAAGNPINPATGAGGNPATVKTSQAVIAVTGTAVQLSVASVPLVNGLIVKSKSSNNAAGQTVGPAGVTNVTNGTGNGYILDAGEAASFGVTNVNAVYVNGTAGDVFSWEGN